MKRAKYHFVGGFGFGNDFSRGRGVTGSGNSAKTPSWVDLSGIAVRIWFIISCAPSRAVVERHPSREVE